MVNNVDFIPGFLTAKQMRVKYLVAKRVKIEASRGEDSDSSVQEMRQEVVQSFGERSFST